MLKFLQERDLNVSCLRDGVTVLINIVFFLLVFLNNLLNWLDDLTRFFKYHLVKRGLLGLLDWNDNLLLWLMNRFITFI